MVNRMQHGVLTPAHKRPHVPARVVNVRSKKKQSNTRIRLDKLIRSTRPRICIKRRLGGIGDVLMTTPLTKALKVLIPQCHLVYATDLKYSQGALGDIIRHNPYVDELIPFHEIRDTEYDYLVDITSTGLSKERPGTIPPNRIDMFAEEVGIDISADPVPIYMIEKSERQWAKKFIKNFIPNPTDQTKMIAIQVRSNDARRTWPLDYVSKLIDLMSADKNLQVFVFDWGATIEKWDKHKADNIHLVMDKPLTQVAGIIDQCDVVVCPDSGMLHLAGALQKKIVTIFGPIPPESRINYYANATVVLKKLPCAPCWYSPKCTKSAGNKYECLTGISPEQVLDAIMNKIKGAYVANQNITYGKNLTNSNQDPIILVRRTTNGLGDILMTTPAIQALKKKYPDKIIEVACQRKLWPALQNNPDIFKLVDSDNNVNPKRYYAVMDISTPCARYEAARVVSGKSVQKSRIEIFAESVGVREMLTTLKPLYYVSKEEKEWAKDFIEKTIHSKKPKLAVGLRSAEMYRDWPEIHFNKLFQKLKSQFEIVLLDHSREYIYKDIIDSCGFPLRKSLAIMAQCDGLITVDTGLLHFGAALDIPTIAIFGPIDYKPRCKGYDKVTVIRSDMDCIPCWRNSSMPCKATGMIRGYSKCLDSISSQEVANLAIKKFLKV